ncbi:MAG: helix-turn-helix domain-containing protein [Candidatus Bathyarchaeota archaeon]
METLKTKNKNSDGLYGDDAPVWKLLRKERKPFDFLADIEKTFLQFDLSRNEIRVYLYLARSGIQKAREISDTLSLHRTETYRILRDLEKRGLISCILEKPLKFTAVPFENAYDVLIKTKKLNVELLERKKKDLVDLWSSIPQQKTEPETKEIFQILEGEEQLILKANEIVDKNKKEICVIAPDLDLLRLYHSGITDNLEKASKKKAKVMLLTNSSVKSRFIAEKMELSNVKYLPMKSDELPSFILSDQKELLFSIKNGNGQQDSDARRRKEKISFLWTNYNTFIRALNLLFTNLWSSETSSANKKLVRVAT